MALERLSSVVRVLVFYLTALLLLIFGGIALQQYGLSGAIVTQLLIFLALPLLFTIAVEQKPLRSFLRIRMLNKKGFLRALLLGTIAWLMAQLMGSAIILLVQQLGGEMIQTYQILLDAPFWLALIGGALVPAVCEEIAFRGYVLGALRPLGPTAAIILTGLLFGALHMSLIRLLPLTLLGLLWALAAQRSGSVLPGMIMHLLNNGIALILAFSVQNQVNPADSTALEGFSPAVTWGIIGFLAAVSIGLAVAAFFLAASFSHRDLARPEEAEAQEPPVEPEQPVFLDPEAVPPELRAMEAELAGLRQRRRLMLQTAGIITGLLILGIYLYAVSHELSQVFG